MIIKFFKNTFLFLFFILPDIHYAQADDNSLVLNTPRSAHYKISTDSAQQAWLKDKKVLRVGLFRNDNPPYDVFSPTREYEGISAEYLGLVSSMLGLNVEIYAYQDRETLWLALQNGDIDIIPSVSPGTESANFTTTKNYGEEQAILAVKSTDRETLPEQLNLQRIAVVRDYLSLADLKAAYPDANFQVYDTTQEALSAVAYGNARAYLGSASTLGQSFINILRIDRFATITRRDIAFATRKNNSVLIDLVNNALALIPPEKKSEIEKSWEAGYSGVMMQQLPLTEGEQKWIKDHKNVNVIVYGSDFSAPMAFVDKSGVVRGIAADILSVVALKTGINFQFSVTDDFKNLIQQTTEDKSQMIASISYSAQRNKELLLSYPYTRTPYVLLTQYDNFSIKQLSDLRGKKLGMLKNASLANEIAQRFPEIKLVFYNSDSELLNAVADKNVDAITGFLIIADYQINNNYRGKVRVANILEDKTAYISFGIGKNNPELHSIINHVLNTLPHYELDMFARRWGANHLVTSDGFWTRYRNTVLIGVSGTLLLMLIVAGRALLLRRKFALAEQAASQLTRQYRMLEELVDTMPFPIKLRDPEGKLTYCNQLALEFFNLPFESIKGRTILEAASHLAPEVAQLINDKHRAAVKNNETFHQYLDMTLINPSNGETRAVTSSVWILPWRDADGDIVGSIFALWDVSDKEELVRQLKDASDRAESSNRAKSTFLSTMSHEIRTPMNAIIGMLDMAIKKGRKGELDIQALEVAHASANGLVGLIGDILDLSRIEGGHLEFRPEKINIIHLIDQLLVIFNGLAIDKNIALKRNFPDENIEDVIGDPLRVKQVFSNILGNAIKFTDSGSVTITIRFSRQLSSQIGFEIEVKDTGIGIPFEQQRVLFKPFSQADNRRAGTGLGLYISKELCRTMQGDLSLESEQFVGTTLTATFILPVAESCPEPEVQTVERQHPVRAFNVLVVDDNEANRILLAKQLAWLGHHAYVAKDGFEALEMWDDNAFDVIISDCNMPGMNGYQFTQRIRETETMRGLDRNWIIGFTANAVPEMVDRCLNAGMDGCLFKPCSISSLEQALQKVN
ncbi:transporter substrate-binding domain-containing protein [Pantoea agglomerans]